MRTKQNFYDKMKSKENRKKLVDAGFKQSTLTMWKTKQRTPDYESAKIIADIFGIPISRVPWIKKNIPQ